jgi:prepilin-type N-terminal cleavage/methylation domain-containing protein
MGMFMNVRRDRSRSAFSLVEVLIAVVVLALGVLGLAAIFPTLLSRNGSLPIGLLITLNALILAGGLGFCWLAARLMLRQNLSDSLRHE